MNSINILFSQGDINKNASIKSYKFVSADRCKALIRHSIDVELTENRTYTLDGFLARCETKLDKLKRKLSDLESKLYYEQSRQIGFSTRREDSIKERIEKVKEQIKQLSNI